MEMIEVFQLCPMLQNLVLEREASVVGVDGQLFKKLELTDPPHNQPPLLPKLSYLSLDLSSMLWEDFDHEPLVCMLKSRLDVSSSDDWVPLQNVDLKLRLEKLIPSSALLAELRQLWDQGLDILVKDLDEKYVDLTNDNTT